MNQVNSEGAISNWLAGWPAGRLANLQIGPTSHTNLSVLNEVKLTTTAESNQEEGQIIPSI